MLLPALTSTPLAAAAGKTGTMFLLNQNNLGGYVAGGPNNDLAEVSVGGCWCGPSYFAVNGKKQRIVGSGGSTLTLWNVKDKSKIRLTLAGSKGLPSGQDGGFLTSVSSNARGHNPIIWALARPQYVPGPLTLVALAANESHGTSPLTTLYQAPAGYWIEDNANANLLPAVANGKVYVASYQQLEIFGLGGSAAVTRSHARRVANVGPIKTPNEVTGTLLTVNGARLTLRTRDGRLVTVDAAAALKNERTGDLVVGKPFNVRGTYDAAGVMHAAAIVRAKPSTSSWPPDR